MKKITLITSMFKGEAHIRGFLENVTRQTAWDDCDLVIYNANSPDNEYEVIKEYSSVHMNIHYIWSAKDPGIYTCWNRMINGSKTKYLTNANIDDRLMPDSIEKHIGLLDQNKDLDIAYCLNVQTTDPKVTDTTLTGDEPIFPTGPYSLFNLLNCNLPHNHPVWRTNLHDRCGLFDTSYHSAADWDFWLRCGALGATMELIPEKLGIYYRNPEGMSTKQENMARNLAEVAKVRNKFVNMLSYLSTR